MDIEKIGFLAAKDAVFRDFLENVYVTYCKTFRAGFGLFLLDEWRMLTDRLDRIQTTYHKITEARDGKSKRVVRR